MSLSLRSLNSGRQLWRPSSPRGGVGAAAVQAAAVVACFAKPGTPASPSTPPATPVTVPAPTRSSVAATGRSDTTTSVPTLIVPVDGVHPSRIRNTFDARRGARLHRAVDILAPRGTPVLAATDGRVWKLRTNTAGGISVYAVDSAEQFVYYYAHLQRYRQGLTEGTRLVRGDVIGYVGTSGNAPANTPHLHFQVMRRRRDGRWWGGEPVDPLPHFTTLVSAR